jgi:predicted RNase H-like nuclease (RuvC/YqgF family)
MTSFLAFMPGLFNFFRHPIKPSKSKHPNGSSSHVNSRAHVQPPSASITHSDEPWEIEVGQKEVERLQAKIKSLNDELRRMEREHANVLKQLNRANRQVEIRWMI